MAEADPMSEHALDTDLVLELTDPALIEVDGVRRATARGSLTYESPGAERLTSPPFDFITPLGAIEKEELAWYLERYHLWPTTVFRARARRVESDLEVWGRQLYDALVMGETRKVFETWRTTPASGSFTVQVDGQNDAAAQILALPWELVHDGEEAVFHGRRDVLVRRRLVGGETRSPARLAAPVRILLITARPREDVDHRVCALPLVDALEGLGDLAELTVLQPPTVEAMVAELRSATAGERPYHIVHFDGHGLVDGTGGLLFEHHDDADRLQRRPLFFPATHLARALKRHRVPMVILQACRSAATDGDVSSSVAGCLSQGGVATVIAMSHRVLIETARRFFTVLYRELAAGLRVGDAMLTARKALQKDDFRLHAFRHALRLQDWFVPVLYQNHDLALVGAAQVAAPVRPVGDDRLASLPAPPDHRFVGRSRELLRAERWLALEPYVVLLGEAGEGKTTLAAELARWLVRTRRFDRAAFVSLDRHPDGKAALLELGAHLVPGFVSQAARDPDSATRILNEALAGERILLVFDNMETALASEDAAEQVVDLAKELAGAGGTRIVFTSRQGLPAPFAENHLRVGRLGRDEAVQLVSNVLGQEDAVPYVEDEGESEAEIVQLVDAVRGHARCLVLLAREVAASGVRRATEDLQGIMEALHEQHPDDRERSLLASVELSLRRLPDGMRHRIRPLAVFRGGGHVTSMASVLGLDQQKDEEVALARVLVGIGLGELLDFGYLRLHPALSPALGRGLDGDARREARRAWAEAMIDLVSFLYEKQFEDARIATSLTVLELPNLLAALDHLRDNAPAGVTVEIATRVESLLESLGRPKTMARVAHLRRAATRGLDEWDPVRMEADSATVDRLIEEGRHAEATTAARRLLERSLQAGAEAYEQAPYYIAYYHWLYGRALLMGGDAEKALPPLDVARRRFQRLADDGNATAGRMVSVCISETAGCLRDVGRFDEAAEAFEAAIELDEIQGRRRDLAADKFQLGTVRLLQRRPRDAIESYAEARDVAEALGESETVSKAWHQIGMVHQQAGDLTAAEEAHQRALRLTVQHGSHSAQAGSYAQLGNVYSSMGRWEEAVRFYRQALAIFEETGDLLNEGRIHNNIAHQWIQLRRFDEARPEILRAIECYEPFGHAAQTWQAYDILHDLERHCGNQAASVEAWEKAFQSFLGYRRSGGENPATAPRLAAEVRQAIHSNQTAAAVALVTQLQQSSDLPPGFAPFLAALQQILAGSRDPDLAANPEMLYECAVELTLLLEALAPEDR